MQNKNPTRKNLAWHCSRWFGITGLLAAVLSLRADLYYKPIVYVPLALIAALISACIGFTMGFKHGPKILGLSRDTKKSTYMKIIGYGILSSFYTWLIVISIVLTLMLGYIAIGAGSGSNLHLSDFLSYGGTILGYSFIGTCLPIMVIGTISLFIFYFRYRDRYDALKLPR